MSSRRNHKHARQSTIALKGEVPNDLVGRRYSSLTDDERTYVNTYREIHKLCTSCGARDHAAASCARQPTITTQDHTSPNVETTAKPKYSRTIPVGEEGRVPYDLVGIAFRDMTADQRDQVYQYRKNNRLCTTCGDKHNKYDCEVRKNTFKRAMAKKKADIRSGKLILNTKLIAPIFKLPNELLLQIFEDAVKEDKPVDVRRGMLYGPCLVPMLHATAIKAFFSVNTFKISGGPQQKAFGRMVKSLGVEKNVHSLYFSSFGHFLRNKFGEGDPSFNGDIQLMR